MSLCAIVNPKSGSVKRLRGAPIESLVAEWLWPDGVGRPDIRLTTRVGDGTRLAHAAIKDGCDTIVAIGGDGTLNEVVHGIALEKSKTVRLGIIPLGTVNVLAQLLDIPLNDPVAAAKIVRNGHVRQLDLGSIGDRRFALVAGFGLDGAVTRSVNLRLKRIIGPAAYVLAGCSQTLKYGRRPITLRLDSTEERSFDAYMTLVANGGMYGGRFQLGPDVALDDGLLDVFVFERRSPLIATVGLHVLALLRGRLSTCAGVHHFQARSIEVASDMALPAQLDGEPVDIVPIGRGTVIDMLPSALSVLTPELYPYP